MNDLEYSLGIRDFSVEIDIILSAVSQRIVEVIKPRGSVKTSG